jgi:acid stress-induced BolA-like protein IbaG/YrbA
MQGKSMDPEDVRQLIEQGLPGARVLVQSDDNTHYSAIVVSELFAGKRPLNRHQMVYQCLGKLMGNEIHALAIRAHTSDEWRDQEQAGSA